MSVPGRPATLDYSRTSLGCACKQVNGGLVDPFLYMYGRVLNCTLDV